MRIVELRAISGRAVVVDPERPEPGAPGPAPDELPAQLPPGLVDDLREWGRVTAMLGGAADLSPTAVSRRGRHLAARLSVALGAPVDYRDPVSGHRVALRAVTRTPRPPPVPVLPRAVRRAPGPPAEATPWATGLALAALTAGLVLLANLALAGPLVASLGWWGVVIDVVVALGLVPALWLNRFVRTWRWAVWGTLVGMASAVPVLAVWVQSA